MKIILKKSKLLLLSILTISFVFSANTLHAQTTLLKDINPGSSQAYIDHPTLADTLLYFIADNDDDEGELYVTNGTEAGTNVISDLAPPDDYPDIEELTPYNGKLVFNAVTDELGRELYISDGTPGGAYLLKDIREGDGWGEPENFAVFDNRVFFSADLGGHPYSEIGEELWVTDGTTSGTVLFKDLAPGYSYNSATLDTSTHDSRPRGFKAINDLLFFTAQTPDEGREPWVSDGTPGGTHLIKDMYPGKDEYDNPIYSYPSHFYNINGKAVFVAETDSTNLRQLFVTDGTEAGTEMIQQFENMRYGGGRYGLDGEPVEYNGSWYFLHDGKLWRSDATPGGTEMILDIADQEYTIDDYRDLDNQLVPFNGKLYFFDEYRLWETDGTASGTTVAVESKFKRVTSYVDRSIVVLDDFLYFVATDDAYGLDNEVGTELWMTDGTSANTTYVKDIRTGTVRGGPDGSEPEDLTLLNGKLIFTANGNDHGREFWVSNGIPERMAVINDSSLSISITEIGVEINFSAIDTSFNTNVLHNIKAEVASMNIPDSLELATSGLWNITTDTTVSFDAEVCFSLDQLSSANADYDQLEIIKRDSDADEWSLLGAETDPNQNTICASGVQSFSDFTIVEKMSNVSIDERVSNNPYAFELEQAYPNPFNPSTNIRYSIPEAAKVSLTIYNIVGQKILTLVNTEQSAGTYNVTFEANNLSSGVYFYRLEAAGKVTTNKMTLLK